MRMCEACEQELHDACLFGSCECPCAGDMEGIFDGLLEYDELGAADGDV